MKVLTILGTRPEIIRLSEVIKTLDTYTSHVLVHTGQNYDYELNEVFFKDLGLRKPDYFLDAAGSGTVETIANILSKTDALLEKEKPEAVLVLGDTNSALAVYAAKRRKIPVFHMEAGNRCFDERVPEELNRRVVDRMSDVNLVYSDRARENLIREGFALDKVIKTGSPLFEVLASQKASINASKILHTLKLKKGEYILASFHREENVTNKARLENIISALIDLRATFGKEVLVSTHPRTRKLLEDITVSGKEDINFLKPFGFHDYVHLQQNAFCAVSDSGTISEESAILGFPAVNLREAHERLEAMDEASVIMSGLDRKRIVQAVSLAVKNASDNQAPHLSVPPDYLVPNVSIKVVRIILSYTDYIKRTVWGQT